MTNNNDKPADNQNTSKAKRDKPTLGGETVEPRILLSATWITGTDAGESLNGTTGADYLEGLGGDDSITGGAGDDTLAGGAGNDRLDGGTGNDTASFESALTGIRVDLTISTAQDTGDGIETITGIENVLGGKFDDTFAFTEPSASQTFTVNGGAGNNTIDLSSWDSSSATMGKGTITIDLGGGESFQVNYENIGTLSFRDGDLEPADLAGNTRPDADAGVDQTVDEGDVVTLTASATSDGDADALSYKWTQTSGPAVRLSDASAAEPTFTAPEGLTNTTVTFEVTASDGKTAAVDAVTININADDDAPTASAGVDQTVDGNTLVTLDATGSTDPENEGLTYTWIQTSGPAVVLSDANTAQPTFTAPDTGSNTSVTFTVSVSDGTNQPVVDTVTVNIGTWTEGDATNNEVSGTTGDDRIRTFAGDDTVNGSAGDDTIDGGAGNDTIDYSSAGSSVTVDLTDTSAQDTGGAGTDTLSGIEGVVGSSFNDTFSFSSPVDGAVYTVDGGGGNNTIDLTNFASTNISFADGSITIDLGGGESFQIAYSNVNLIDLSDLDARVMTSNINAGSYIGSSIWIDGPQAFRIDHSGAGSINWSYDVSTDTFSVTDTSNTNATTDLVIQDLNGSDLSTAITIDKSLGSVTSNVDIDSITITSGGDTVGMITIAGGTGTLGAFTTTSGDLQGATVINANVTSINLNNHLKDPLTINGSVGSFSVTDIDAAVQVTANVDTLTVRDIKASIQINGSIANWTSRDINSATTINGSVTSMTVEDVDADLRIDGDLDTAIITSVKSSGTVTASGVTGVLAFEVDSIAYGDTFASTTEYTFNGATQSASYTQAANTAPTAAAGFDQVVNEGELVTLDGDNSVDADGDTLTFTWVQISGPTVTLSDANAAQPTFTAPNGLSNTTITFRLQVDDGKSSPETDSVTITINADDDAPTANAGVDQSANEGDVVTLTGVASSDPESQGLTYTWVQASGPAVALDDANAAQPTFTAPEGLANTSVQFELTVNDGTNTSSADSITVNINADNDAPTAEAGPPQTVNEGDDVTLTGTASSDPEAQGLSYTWTQTSGPAVVLNNANAAQPTFTAPEGLSNTSVQFELTVSDGSNTSSADSVTITINADNDAPTANAGVDQSASEGDVVTLSATDSSDPEGQDLTYSWTQTKGPAVSLRDANTATPTFTAPEGLSNTQVQFQLTASDGTTASIDTVTINLSADNDAPVSNAGLDQRVTEDAVVQLDGSASSDVEGEALTYNWVQVSGPTVTLDNPTSAQPTFQAPNSISNTDIEFELVVSDGNLTSSSSVTVTVNADNDAPTANAGRDGSMQEGNTFTLNGGASSDPEEQGLTYKWTQISGPTIELDNPNAAVAEFTAPEFLRNTSVQFELTVSDGTHTATDTISIAIAADDDAPSVSAGRDRVVLHNQDVQLQASATDPEDQGLTYQWRQVSGPSVELNDATSNKPSFESPYAPGGAVLQFAVSVSDGNSTSYDTVNIVVAPNTGPQVQIVGDTEVTAGDFAMIGATAGDLEGDGLTYKWTQLSGPSVTLPADDQPQLRFQTPNVTGNQEVTFRVEVSDGDRTTTQTVTITLQGEATDTVTTTSSKTSSSDATRQPEEEETAAPIAPVVAEDFDFSTTNATTSPSTTDSESETTTTEAEPLTLGSLAAATLSSEDATEVRPSTLTAEEDTDADTFDMASAAETSTIEGIMAGNLLEDAGASSKLTPVASADLLVADAGGSVQLRAPLTALEASKAATKVRWTQISGTPVEVADETSDVLLVSMPEVFAAEEVVFSVEVTKGGETFMQEVTVQVQPIGMTSRSLSIDEHLDNQEAVQESEDDQGSRGLGKIWGALLAFFGTQSGRKKD